MIRLVSAEATISALKQQVTALSSSESLARVRETYSSALAQTEKKHRAELAQAMADTEAARDEVEAKVSHKILKQKEVCLKKPTDYYIRLTCGKIKKARLQCR